MTVWVGLTGGIGSGKSQVAANFSSLDVPIIDADSINREIIHNKEHIALYQIKQKFGLQALHHSGCLNTQYIRELIFRQPEKKQQLENILHPHILKNIQLRQQNYSHIYGIIELPTLKPNSPFLRLIDSVLVVRSDEQERIKRIKQRNGFDESLIKNIINQQINDMQRIMMADDIIDNNGSLSELVIKVRKQHQTYLQRFTKKQQ